MKYAFKTQDEEIEKYLFNLKESCIIEHEDNWFKEKSHTKLYPNIEDAKAKIAKPHYWILNAIDEYESADEKNESLIALAILVFKSNYYSQKLVAADENFANQGPKVWQHAHLHDLRLLQHEALPWSPA